MNLQTRVYYTEKSHPYVPTRGLATSAWDVYRSSELILNEHQPINSGIIFHQNYNDIAAFEDEIKSLDDIHKFESSLRFLILREELTILEPSVRISNHSNGHVFDRYARIPDYAKDSANALFNKASAINGLLPTEKITITGGKVISSTNPNSIYIGVSDSNIIDTILIDTQATNFIRTLPSSLSIPFMDSFEQSWPNIDGIYADFLSSLDSHYSDNCSYTVGHGFRIELPFFTNAVLSIAKGRDEIPDAILELRALMSPLRDKLFKYEREFTSIKSSRELALLQSDIKRAIHTMTKKIYEPQSLFSDTVNLIINTVTSPHQLAGKLINPNYSPENEFPVLFGNTNYKLMKGLISMDNINTNIGNFLTEQEISRISA